MTCFGGGFLTLLREMPEEDVFSHLATKQGPRSFVLPLIREPQLGQLFLSQRAICKQHGSPSKSLLWEEGWPGKNPKEKLFLSSLSRIHPLRFTSSLSSFPRL